MDNEDCVTPYLNRGLNDVMLARVYQRAYDDCHSGGEEEVVDKFRSLMHDLFLMQSHNDKPANLG